MRNFYKIIALAFVAAITFSCVGDDDFTPPNFEGTSLDFGNAETTINIVKGAHEQEVRDAAFDAGLNPDASFDADAVQNIRENTVIEFPEEEDTYLEGYVISSDVAGNFFEELFLQNAPEDPTAGLRVAIDVNPLFTRYEFGQRIFVNLKGLALGIDNGVYTIGVKVGDEVEQIAPSVEEQALLRDNLVAQIVPKTISISEFDDDLVATYIKIEDVQFALDEVFTMDGPKSFAAEPTDQFQGERFIESCADGGIAIFSTSTFSDFSSLALPEGQGSFEGVLTYNFFGDTFNIKINRRAGLNFDNPERCDPVFVECGTVPAPGANTLLFENFETQSTGAAAMPAGWTNYQEAGTETWEVYTSGGTNASLGKSVRVGSFQSNDASTVAWLITPQFDFDTTTGEVLSFETSNSFADNSSMEVMYSNDWDGTDAGISNATWAVLGDATIVQNSDFFGAWIFSENVSLDCVTGTGNIAFRYEGSGSSDFDGTYELDNISLTSD